MAMERAEEGREPYGGTRVCDAARTDGGRGTWSESSFFKAIGESGQRVFSDPALDGLPGETDGRRIAVCVSPGEDSDSDLERRRK